MLCSASTKMGKKERHMIIIYKGEFYTASGISRVGHKNKYRFRIWLIIIMKYIRGMEYSVSSCELSHDS